MQGKSLLRGECGVGGGGHRNHDVAQLNIIGKSAADPIRMMLSTRNTQEIGSVQRYGGEPMRCHDGDGFLYRCGFTRTYWYWLKQMRRIQ